jgi:hypothetical protein
MYIAPFFMSSGLSQPADRGIYPLIPWRTPQAYNNRSFFIKFLKKHKDKK